MYEFISKSKIFKPLLSDDALLQAEINAFLTTPDPLLDRLRKTNIPDNFDINNKTRKRTLTERRYGYKTNIPKSDMDLSELSSNVWNSIKNTANNLFNRQLGLTNNSLPPHIQESGVSYDLRTNKQRFYDFADSDFKAERVKDFSDFDTFLGQRRTPMSYVYGLSMDTPEQKQAEDIRIKNLMKVNPNNFLQASKLIPYHGERKAGEIYLSGRVVGEKYKVPFLHTSIGRIDPVSGNYESLSGFPDVNDRLEGEFNDGRDGLDVTNPYFRVIPPIDENTGRQMSNGKFYKYLETGLQNYINNGNPIEYAAIGNEIGGDQIHQTNSNSIPASLLGYRLNGIPSGNKLISRRLFLQNN